ncbi:unnamed protein product [Pylaiella littoralis]
MSLVTKSRKALRTLEKALIRAWRAVLQKITGKSEMRRMLERHGGYSSALVHSIAQSIGSSSQLEPLGVFGKPFDISSVCSKIAEAKGIGDEDHPRLVWCLQVLNAVNTVHEKTQRMRQTKYDAEDPAHVAQLEALWASLKPGSRRTDGWESLGFQNGERPESDFRGMGLLGLHQLVFFAEARNVEAQQILSGSINPKRYYPFAAAGINITAFTVSMLEQRRLDSCLYDAIVKYMPAGQLPEDEEMLVTAGFAAFNHIYGDEYVEFSRFWHASNPESTMAFPGILKTIKQRSYSRFPRLMGEE